MSNYFKINGRNIFIKNLLVDIYISGNSIEGESILILLKSNMGVIHSMLIDSYVGNKEENPLLKVLNDNNVKELDILIWSHPHEDHTKGMIKILEIYDERIKEIVVPPYLHGNEKNYMGEVKEVFDKINEINLNNIRNKSLTQVTFTEANHYIVDKKIIQVFNLEEDIEFNIYAISPMSNLIRNRELRGNFNDLNDFSIAVYYNIGDFLIFNTGDIGNLTINQLRDNTLDRMYVPNIIKIPHHGSNGSNKLIDFFETQRQKDPDNIKINIAATTAYRKHKLPCKSVIDGYKNLSDKVYKINDNIDDDAIIKINVDIINRNIKIEQLENYIEC